jgi:hypothetical protein
LIPLNFTYNVFGLFLRCNLALPELKAVDAGPAESPPELGDSAVTVRLKSSPPENQTVHPRVEQLTYASSYKDQAGHPALTIWKADDSRYLRLSYFDGTEFWLDREGAEIWATWPDNLTVEDTATYLLGPVLGLLLRIRGVTCLHASAVVFDGQAVAFVGSEGAGKSTTAAALARQGYAILSDDVVALAELDGSFFVHPAYPYLCLWPESVESLYGSAEALPQFSANYEKRCLSLPKQDLRFAERPLPLAAIYILGERRGDPAPVIEELEAQKAFLAVVANTFATNTLDSAMRAKEFAALGRLAPKVRIRSLCAHQDPSRLSDLGGLIQRDIQEMNPRKFARS